MKSLWEKRPETAHDTRIESLSMIEEAYAVSDSNAALAHAFLECASVLATLSISFQMREDSQRE